MKSVYTLLEQKGGTKALACWVEFFTMQANLVAVSPRNQLPIDQFFYEFNYTPTPMKCVRKVINESTTPEELEVNLANLFHLSDMPLIHFLVL